MIKTVNSCRLCGSTNIPIIWDFGYSPLANKFKNKADLDKPEFEAPLRYFKCSNCHSVQLKDEVASEILFSDYGYESPPNLIPHFKELAKTTTEFLELKSGGIVLDIGSNNGLLLQEYKKLGYTGFGVEPAERIAEKARQNGIPTFNEYFNKGFAQYLNTQSCFPKLITCTNCFAHLSDLDGFVDGLNIIMGKDSYFVFENAYLSNTIKNLDFGQAYFEHFFMHSIAPLQRFFDKYGLELFKVEYNDIQMGSIRGYVRGYNNRHINKDESIIKAILSEGTSGLTTNLPYISFNGLIQYKKKELIQKLENIKKERKSISIYAWPAKMTLLNKYFGLEKYIDYTVEESSIKVGKYAPGTRLEIKNLDYFKNNPTDYCILGAYNFEKDIKDKNSWYQGEWINPLNV